MGNLKHEISVQEGIAHVRGFAEDNLNRPLSLLDSGEGSRSGCLSSCKRVACCRSLLACFERDDLLELKQWAYVGAKVRAMDTHESLSGNLVEDLLWPLISDNEEIIEWYRQFDAQYWPDDPKVTGGDKRNPKDWMYYRYQSWLALNHRWDELAERCERILAMQDEIKKDRMYLIDHRFYLALARGQKAEMEAVLLEMCQPKLLAMRHKQESGLTDQFIASHATIFGKLAWRNGYEVEVDTPWIPKDWLPIRPNAVYEDPWPFMKRFDIWQPFKEPWNARSPRKGTPATGP